MSGWLHPLRAALDDSDRVVTFFFRDDDAGWDDDALEAVLDVFARRSVPLDVAAIPTATRSRTVDLLTARRAGGGSDVIVHQHGYAHVNHEPVGRKCEFGVSRSAEQQIEDIGRGRELMKAQLGELPAVFTPPWNRCAAWTGEVLRNLGFTVLSRDSSAGALQTPGLTDLPITVDWFAKRKGISVDPFTRGALLAEAARRTEPVGVMLHHEVMSGSDLASLDSLLALVSDHPRAFADHLDRLATATGS